MIRRIVLGTVLTAAAFAANATDLGVALNNDMAEVTLRTQRTGTQVQGAEAGAGILFNQDNDLVGSALFHVTNDNGQRWQPLILGVGLKGYGIHLDDEDKNIGALGLGGSAKIGIPAQMPMDVYLAAHYAPDILSSSDGKSVTEVLARYELGITKGATAFVGYRLLRVDLKHHSAEKVDDSFHLGLKLTF